MISGLVNILILVLLEPIDLGESVDLLNVQSGSIELIDLLGDHENVDESIEKDFEEFGVLGDEQVAHWLQDLALDEVEDLVG